jgi:hypothetical protein
MKICQPTKEVIAKEADRRSEAIYSRVEKNASDSPLEFICNHNT